LIALLAVASILAGHMIPTSTHATVSAAKGISRNAQAVAVFLHKSKNDEELARIPTELRKVVGQLLKTALVTGKSNELTIQMLERQPWKCLMVVGLGNFDEFSGECLREAGGVVAKAAQKHKIGRVALILPPVPTRMPGMPNTQRNNPGTAIACGAMA